MLCFREVKLVNLPLMTRWIPAFCSPRVAPRWMDVETLFERVNVHNVDLHDESKVEDVAYLYRSFYLSSLLSILDEKKI